MGFEKKVLILGVFLLVLTNFYLWLFLFRIADGNLKVVFFDVGQGDAIFIETPQGHQILIDGGPSGKKVLEKLQNYIPFWDKTLDLVILTHPDYDHLKGLLSVLQKYDVKNVLWTGIEKNTKTFEEWREAIGEENAQIAIAQAGQEIKAGKAEFFVLYPFEKLQGKVFKKASNDTSLILKLLFFHNSFLFPGDTTSKIERQLLEKKINISSEVLKIAHHGSKSSSQKEFLQSVSPQLAVISVGRNNPYHHPHQEVLNNLANFGIKVLRTDEKGDIKVVSNGRSLKIKTQR